MIERFWHRRTRARLQAALQDGHCTLVDFGSSKISCAMLRRLPTPAQSSSRNEGMIDHKWQIIGHTVTAVQGIENGQIRDGKRAEAALRTALSQLFRMSKVLTKYALVSYSGPIIRSELQPTSCLLSSPVTGRDLSRAIANCRQDRHGYSEFIIHEHLVDLHIDGSPVFGDPIGRKGRRLVMQLHRVVIPRYAVETIETVLNKCGLLVAGLNLSSLAAGASTLIGDEIAGNAIVVDIGSGTTNMAAFNRHAMVWSTTLSLGGDDLTAELCTAFGIDKFQAERIKVLYGSTAKIPGDRRDRLTFPGGSRTEQREITISRELLHAVLVGKQGELTEGIRANLDSLGWCHDSGIPVVLTGGGSRLAGLVANLQNRIGNPVRLGAPARIAGMPETMRNESFAALIGLALLGIRPAEEAWDYPHVFSFGMSPDDGFLQHTLRWLVANW